MLLKLHNVYAGYDGSDVLKGIDLQVEQGTTTCIVGPNGAGKSTVLRVLSGLLKPRVGEITFDGQSIVGMSPRQILALGIVQVPQSHSLFPSLPVRENVRLGAYMLRDAALVERLARSRGDVPHCENTRAGQGRQPIGRTAAARRICALSDARPAFDHAGRAIDGAGPQNVQTGDRDD